MNEQKRVNNKTKERRSVYLKYHKGHLVLVVRKGSQFVSMGLSDSQIFRLYKFLKRHIVSKYKNKKKTFKTKRTFYKSDKSKTYKNNGRV